MTRERNGREIYSCSENYCDPGGSICSRWPSVNDSAELVAFLTKFAAVNLFKQASCVFPQDAAKVPFHCGRTLFGLDVREVHRLRVLLQGHRPVDLQALIQRVKNFIGQWTDTTLRAILVVVVGQLARDLLTVHTVADMPSTVGLVDVSLLHVENLSDQG